MASYPGAKVKRPNRLKLGRGQSTPKAPAHITVTGSASTMHLAFDVPVVVNGPIAVTVATRTIVSQTVVDSQHVDVLMSGTVTGLAYTVPAAQMAIATFQGGTNAAAAGTFS